MKKSSRSKLHTPAFEDRRTLLRNLEETKRELDLAHIGFNQSTDPDLIEFYLYEIDALRARHTYLLRQIKAMDPTRAQTAEIPVQESIHYEQQPN